MRESLLVLAAAAGAWAIAVLGIATNRPFGMFLFVVALLLFIAAHREEWVIKRWWRARLLTRVIALAAWLPLGFFGWFLATNFNEPAAASVDEEARRQATLAQQQTGDLKADVAALKAQVKAAMDFQATEKEVREAQQKREDDERRRRQTLYAELSGLIDSGRKARIALFDLKNGEAVGKLNEWAKGTPVKLRSLSLTDCAEAFENPVRGASITYNLPADRDRLAFAAIALIASLEDCRTNHARQ